MAPYKLSFTFGGLLIPESVSIANAYLETEDWQEVRRQVMEENILQKTRSGSRFRYFREIRDRLQQAFRWELEILKTRETEVQRLVLFLVVCRYYHFVRDFYIEVIKEKLEKNDLVLEEYEYPSFVERKADDHPEIMNVSDSTDKKIHQVVLRILREAGLLNKIEMKIRLQYPIVPEAIVELYRNNGAENEISLLLF